MFCKTFSLKTLTHLNMLFDLKVALTCEGLLIITMMMMMMMMIGVFYRSSVGREGWRFFQETETIWRSRREEDRRNMK